MLQFRGSSGFLQLIRLCLLMLCLDIFTTLAQGYGNPYRGYGSDNYYNQRRSIVELCDTYEGLEGECHPHSECWLSGAQLKPCQTGHYCCPDMTDRNLAILAGEHVDNYPQQPHWRPPMERPRPPYPGEVPGGVHRPPYPGREPYPGVPYPMVTQRPRPRVPTPVTVVTTTRRAILDPIMLPSSEDGCGKRFFQEDEYFNERTDIEPHVLGGHDAEDHSWPWVVSLYLKRNAASSRFLCGGSLISPRHVLTAAHCFDIMNQGFVRFSVKVGSNHVSTSKESPNQTGEFINVEDVRVHEQYVTKQYNHDIAVLLLAKSVTFSDSVSPICLPSPQQFKAVVPKANVTLVGWGHKKYGGSTSNVLQEAGLQIIPLRNCQVSYQTIDTQSSLPQGITSRMMCAGRPQGGVDACQGDSGGPLMMEAGNHRWIQVGVVSFGFRCGVEQFPGVYTRVSSYINWVNSVLNEH